MNPANWNGRRVLVTGHTGFKGGWLTLWLASLGAEVHGYSLAPKDICFFSTTSLAENMQSSVLADLRDLDELRACMERVKPEVVFHLAAQALVRQSYQNPLETYTTNVIGTANLLEAIRTTTSVKAVVIVTTDKCYENREWEWGYRENDPVGGHDPYSSSKACVEILTTSWRRSFLEPLGIRVASARAGNVLGGGDWSDDRLLPDFLRALDTNKPLVIRSPDAIRPWQHVLEPLSGYILLAEKLLENTSDFAQAWNFGPNDEDAKPVNWMIRHLKTQCPDVQVLLESSSQPHEANFLKLDISKARQSMGWQPRWRLAEALERTVEWHKAWRQGRNMSAFSLTQIVDYTATQTA